MEMKLTVGIQISSVQGYIVWNHCKGALSLKKNWQEIPWLFYFDNTETAEQWQHVYSALHLLKAKIRLSYKSKLLMGVLSWNSHYLYLFFFFLQILFLCKYLDLFCILKSMFLYFPLWTGTASCKLLMSVLRIWEQIICKKK